MALLQYLKVPCGVFDPDCGNVIFMSGSMFCLSCAHKQSPTVYSTDHKKKEKSLTKHITIYTKGKIREDRDDDGRKVKKRKGSQIINLAGWYPAGR